MAYRYLFACAAIAAASAALPAAAQEYDWNGFYVGVNLGGAWGDTSIDSSVGPGTGPIVLPPVDADLINQTGADDDNKTGFTGGGQIGFNYQMGALLLGIEADYGALDIDQQRTNSYQSAFVVNPPINPPVTYTLDQRVKTGWIWTVRPRVGYVAGPWMVYATGGIATTKIKLTTQLADNRTPPNFGEIKESNTKTGWAAGLGGGYMFTPNISVRGEWLYADFGKVRDTVTTTNGFATLTSEANVKANILRLGLDYKF